jgi:hypothetical protein
MWQSKRLAELREMERFVEIATIWKTQKERSVA